MERIWAILALVGLVGLSIVKGYLGIDEASTVSPFSQPFSLWILHRWIGIRRTPRCWWSRSASPRCRRA